ncbi:hypothetical protein CHUAL_007007 [Chamberlinius hualienensis]
MIMDQEQNRGEYIRIRQLRKKLRQIEVLERLSRSLNSEESAKVVKKNVFREELQSLLKRLPVEHDQDHIPTALIVSTENNVNDSLDSSGEFDISEIQVEDNVVSSESKPDKEELSDDMIETAGVKRTHDERLDQVSPSPVPVEPKKLKTANNQISESSSSSEIKNLQRIWGSSEFSVQELTGHNDIITAVVADGHIVVTSSRDTTVKVWNPDKPTEQEVFSLRGHNGAVTCLVLLSKSDSDELSRYLGLIGSHRLALSGGTDCSIILWSLTTGELKKSIYTFNTVTCVAYMQPEICYVTATDGGKLQIWDAIAGTLIRSLTAYDDGYTCMKAEGSLLYTASNEGIIQVWEMLDRNLTQRFSMDELELPEGSDVILRTVRCMEVRDDWVYYGDDGPNIKAFNWKTKKVKKFSNHIGAWGATDAIAGNGQEIISSSYNLDESKGHLNVRLYPGGNYVCSLDDGATDRICCMAFTYTSFGNLRIATGGSVLKIWDIYQPPFAGRRHAHKGKPFLKPMYVKFYEKKACQSDYESSDVSDTSESEDAKGRYMKTYIPTEITDKPTIWRYCSIL